MDTRKRPSNGDPSYPARSDSAESSSRSAGSRSGERPSAGATFNVAREQTMPPRCESTSCRVRSAVASCFTEPTASADEKARIRTRQYHAAANQLIGSVVGGLFTVIVILALYGGVGDPLALGLWACVLVAIVAWDLAGWWKHRNTAETTPVSPSRTRWLALQLGLSGLVYGVIVPHLLVVTDADQRAALIGVTAAFVAGGAWQYAPMPWAALAWTWGVSLPLTVGFFSALDGTFAYLAAAMLTYALFLTLGSLTTSRNFLARLRAESHAESQSQLLALVLNDFEESASDWLWEFDANRRLRHVSARAAARFGYTVAALRGRDVVELAFRGLVAPSAADLAAFARFRRLLDGGAPFRDVVVPLDLRGERRWWSVTARPLVDGSGARVGWRGVTSDVTIARRATLELERLASVDSLTGLANRHRFQERLAELLAPQEGEEAGCTLLLLDLDHFKNVNDVLGHPAGDRLLRVVADRIRDAVSGDALVARLGGDEFTVLLRQTRERVHVIACAERIRAALACPVELEGYRVDVRASLGVAVAPDDAATGDALLRAADMALYRAKASGRDTLAFFEPALEAAASAKHALLADLREALCREEFLLHYQPQWDLSTGSLVGFEALVRWDHPRRGMISPGEFIPIAEESGLILPLGAWVLEEACRAALRWPDALKVAVNVSAVQFDGTDVEALVRRVLAETGLPPHRLEVELTESLLVHERTAVVDTLEGLRRLGVGVALDDFGTGYSSLAYLRAFPIDKLKVDRSFVSRIDDEGVGAGGVAIVKAIVDLASALGLATVAEGVETDAQRDVLRSLGCAQAQGYLFAKPMALDAVEAMLELSPGEPRRSRDAAPSGAPAEVLGHVTTRSARPETRPPSDVSPA